MHIKHSTAHKQSSTHCLQSVREAAVRSGATWDHVELTARCSFSRRLWRTTLSEAAASDSSFSSRPSGATLKPSSGAQRWMCSVHLAAASHPGQPECECKRTRKIIFHCSLNIYPPEYSKDPRFLPSAAVFLARIYVFVWKSYANRGPGIRNKSYPVGEASQQNGEAETTTEAFPLHSMKLETVRTHSCLICFYFHLRVTYRDISPYSSTVLSQTWWTVITFYAF